MAASIVTGGDYSAVTEHIWRSNAKDNNIQSNDVMIESISKLKEFKKLISDTLAEENIDRMIIFIDDLDRLNPKTALDLLESTKKFINCIIR